MQNFLLQVCKNYTDQLFHKMVGIYTVSYNCCVGGSYKFTFTTVITVERQ